ncbi:hypothetical protein Tco_0948493 [Tanacetum coccineum]
MIRFLEGKIGKFATMAVMMILLLLLPQKQIQRRYTLHLDTDDYLIISKAVSNIFIEAERILKTSMMGNKRMHNQGESTSGSSNMAASQIVKSSTTGLEAENGQHADKYRKLKEVYERKIVKLQEQ